jgi:hypothetical protein
MASSIEKGSKDKVRLGLADYAPQLAEGLKGLIAAGVRNDSFMLRGAVKEAPITEDALKAIRRGTT